jgi:ankyrin repeat protein
MKVQFRLVLGLSLMELASSCGKGHDSPEQARMKLAQLNMPYSEDAFVAALQNNDGVAIRLFQDAGMDTNHGLLKSILAGNAAAVSATLQHGADPNATMPDGWPAMHVAAQNGRLQIINLLLDKGAKIDIKSRDGQTALNIAVSNHQWATARGLLERGADVNGGTSDVTPCYRAAMDGDEATLKLLLEHHADLSRGPDGVTPLGIARAWKNQKIVELLIANGAK